MKQLSPCPSSPNCVSTQAHDEGHAIAPFRYRKSRAEAKEVLKEVIRSLPRTKLLEEDESYRVFNMGVGMVVVVPASDASNAGLPVIGHITDTAGVDIR